MGDVGILNQLAELRPGVRVPVELRRKGVDLLRQLQAFCTTQGLWRRSRSPHPVAEAHGERFELSLSRLKPRMPRRQLSHDLNPCLISSAAISALPLQADCHRSQLLLLLHVHQRQGQRHLRRGGNLRARSVPHTLDSFGHRTKHPMQRNGVPAADSASKRASGGHLLRVTFGGSDSSDRPSLRHPCVGSLGELLLL
jgi:hypothetical protein